MKLGKFNDFPIFKRSLAQMFFFIWVFRTFIKELGKEKRIGEGNENTNLKYHKNISAVISRP